jgi:hypothetical protein
MIYWVIVKQETKQDKAETKRNQTKQENCSRAAKGVN